MFTDIIWSEVLTATWDTLYMVGISTVLSLLIGLPLGILLLLCSPEHLLSNKWLYQSLSILVNVFRSIPFIILMIAIIPFTEWLIGTSIGVNAAMVPLVIGAAPFFARLAETALREVDGGVIEAAQSMGASTWQIIVRVLLPEARAGLISAVTITAVALVSYSAMSGVIGGGGLGDLAIRYGYERFQTDVMVVTIIILIFLVQLMQIIGDKWVQRVARRA